MLTRLFDLGSQNYANKLGAGPPPPGMTGWSAGGGPNGLTAPQPGSGGAHISQAQQGLAQSGAVGAAHAVAGHGAGAGGRGEEVQTPAQQVLHSPADRFGLLGLLSIIKMQDPDSAMLSLGTDLQSLGLSMEAQE